MATGFFRVKEINHFRLISGEFTSGGNFALRSINVLKFRYGGQLTSASLRSYDGNCKENVSLKLNFALSCLLRLFHVVQNRRSALSLAWHE